MDFDFLKKLCKERGMTIKILAQAVGMTEAGFHKAIRQNSLRVNVLEKCAEVLNVKVFELFLTGEEIPKTKENVSDAALRHKYYSVLERTNVLLEENMELRRIIEQLRNGKK